MDLSHVLTPKQKRVVELTVADFCRREIAAIQGVTPQAVKKHLSRARSASRRN